MSRPPCAVDGCGRAAFCRGWCRTHYNRWRETGSVGEAVIRTYSRLDCSVEGCGRPHLAQGYCGAHYRRWQKSGDPGPAAIQVKDSSRSCSLEGCDGRAAGHGLCRTHLARKTRTGSTGPAEIKRLTDPTARDESGAKRCPSCERWMPESSFTACASTPDGLYKRCRTCTRAAMLWRSYGLTIDAYDTLLAAQSGGCRICARVPEEPYSLHVDHDHACCPVRKRSCGKCVRGLLCSPCNTALGLMTDDPKRLRVAADYLEQARDRG